jgi:hypothetical protein
MELHYAQKYANEKSGPVAVNVAYITCMNTVVYNCTETNNTHK